MIDSGSVRKTNKNLIRKILWGGGSYTKQEIAQLSGLSVATCNTILNELENSTEVIGKKERLKDVGRSTTFYYINESYENILCLEFRLIKGIKSLSYCVLSTIGNTIEYKKTDYATIDYQVIAATIERIVNKYPMISFISIGTPSIADKGIIRHCDISELEGEELVLKLTEIYQLPVILENDMHFKSYGYYKKECTDEDIVTLVNFPKHILPGTGTIISGNILRGTHNFAGMVGFLPYGISREKELEMLAPKTYFPYATQSVASIIVLFNPKVIIFTGDLLNETEVEKIKISCKDTIPKEYMPEFVFIEDIDSYFLEGMFKRALDLKGVIE